MQVSVVEQEILAAEILEPEILESEILELEILEQESVQKSDCRCEPRIEKQVSLRLRFRESEPFASEEVISENVSSKGLGIITEQRMEPHTRVYIETLNRKYRAIAVVVHSDGYKSGLQILKSNGEI